MTHLSLFSGIGGLDLAAEMAGFETVGQCEWADYPYSVLQKHWPDVPKWRDIRTLTGGDFRARTGVRTVDVVSGGFPCQPHSVAGKRKASADDRDLWPDMRRVIGEFKPKWIVAENVRGLLSSEDGRFVRRILRDFANMGYDVGWCVISAAGVGALHRRERLAIVAHSNSKRLQGRPHARSSKKMRTNPQKQLSRFLQTDIRTDISILQTYGEPYGIPAGMDRNQYKETIMALGNAVVPQQFYPIFKAIAEIEKERIYKR